MAAGIGLNDANGDCELFRDFDSFETAVYTFLDFPFQEAVDGERLHQLRSLHDWVNGCIPSSYVSQKITDVIHLFKRFYLQKNAEPEIEARAKLGYPIQNVQEIEDSMSYHRDQNGEFFACFMDQIVLNYDVYLKKYCHTTLVLSKLMISDLKIHGIVHEVASTDDLDVVFANFFEDVNGIDREKNIHIIVKLSEEEKRYDKKQQMEILQDKREPIFRHLMILLCRCKSVSVLKLFSMISVFELNDDISFVLYNKDRVILHRVLRTGIYMPTQIQMLKCLAELEGTGLEQDEMIPQGLNEELFTETDLSESFHYQSYTALAEQFERQDPSAPEFASLLASGNLNMVQELMRIMTASRGKLDDEETRVIAASLKRIETLMMMSVQQAQRHTKYSMLHELMAEEILLLLNLMRPYTPECFNRIMQELSPLNVDHQVTPVAIPFSSGMAALNAAMGAISLAHGSCPKIAYAMNCYYEFKHLPLFSTVEERDDDSVLSSQSMNIFSLDVDNWQEECAEMAAAQFFPDAVVLSIRAIPSPGGVEYLAIKNVKALIRSLLLSAEKPHFTIVLDVTNDKIQSKELAKLLSTFVPEIESRAISFVLFRSGHKFVQLGVDKVNAGYLELYTAHEDLKERFLQQQGTLTGLDYQALCHYMRCASREIHQYTKIQYKNSQTLYAHLERELERAEEYGLLPIENKDAKSYYVQLLVKARDLPVPDVQRLKKYQREFSVAAIDAVSRMALREGIDISRRDSFGFNQTATCDIANTVRISLGSHDKAQMHKFCAIFAACHNLIRSYGAPAAKRGRDGAVIGLAEPEGGYSMPHLIKTLQRL